MYENCFLNFCEISAYFRRSYFWNTVYQEVVSLPFDYESQVTIFNKHENLFLEIAPCDSE
ncbi:hypothetical protein CI258_008990 [Enterococcus faecium]|nr:hypothetical protein CI258_008990 [Enterococcus faecium]